MPEPAGERRIVTVLMADVAGSTAIGEQLGPERSKFLFDEVTHLMAEEVRRLDGTVAQLTGDGLFALFGAPTAHEDDSERAVRVALAIHEALAAYAREVEEAYGVRLAGRVGIHTGPVVLPGEGAPPEERYNALGDTVNVAARLQALAGESGVVVGPATAHQIEGRFELEALGKVELKGKSAPVAAFRVVREREARRVVPEAPLVGRDAELAVLTEVFGDLAEGRGAIVSITGEPGIGKSRLVAELRAGCGDRVRFLEGHAISYASSFPYWPVRELLRGWLGVGASDPEARVRLELKTGLARALGDRSVNAYPFVATLLGLALEPDAASTIRDLSRDSVQRQTFEAVHDLVLALGAARPLCLVLDDLHWADETTLELLEELLAVTEEEAVALLLLYRAERERASWRLGEQARRLYPHRFRELELHPLDPEESKRLAGSAAGAELPEAVAELLADRAGGNPFFLEEALRDLVERGALRRADGRFELTIDPGDLRVPAVVQEALQARLDRLAPRTRELVSVAAVIGRSFAMPLLERLEPGEKLAPVLSELQRLDLVVEERRRPAAEYRFRHGLVREAAYASLLEERRRELHRRVGLELEDLHRNSPEEVYGLLGHHFAEAGEVERAAEYLLGAGDAFRAVYSDEEAVTHYRRALCFLDELGAARRARETLFKIALTHHLAFDFERANDAWAEAFGRPVEEAPGPPPTERIATSVERPRAFVPGLALRSDEWFLCGHLFRGLLRVDRSLNVVPDLAERIEVARDGLTYRFRLRGDARWSDGRPVTAGDFAFTWRQMRELGVETAVLLGDIEEAVAADARTLVLRLREPRNYFPYLLGSPPAFPWPSHVVEDFGDRWRLPEHIVGNGPFRVSAFDEERLMLTANPAWDRPRGNVAEIEIEFMEGLRAQEAWLAGRFDVLSYFLDAGATSASDTIVEFPPSLTTAYVGFSAGRPPFDDARVRKAFAHAVDRERAARLVRGSAQPAAGGFVPPSLPGHSHRIDLGYDPEQARALLAEAGYPGGARLPELELGAAGLWAPLLADDLAEQWAEVGARVRVLRAPMHEFDPGAGHFWAWAWEADYPDPGGMLHPVLAVRSAPALSGSGERRAYPQVPELYRDAELDELLARARSARDQDERLRLFREFERRWLGEEAALVPVVYPRSTLVRRPWIELASGALLRLPALDEAIVRRASS